MYFVQNKERIKFVSSDIIKLLYPVKINLQEYLKHITGFMMGYGWFHHIFV